MLNSLIKSLYISVPMVLSMAIYFQADKKYEITDKISSKIRANKKWQPLIVVCFCFLFMLIFGISNIYILNIPTNLYFILSSLMTGAGVGFANKLSTQTKNT